MASEAGQERRVRRRHGEKRRKKQRDGGMKKGGRMTRKRTQGHWSRGRTRKEERLEEWKGNKKNKSLKKRLKE